LEWLEIFATMLLLGIYRIIVPHGSIPDRADVPVFQRKKAQSQKKMQKGRWEGKTYEKPGYNS
jgi:hypothetical protein